MSTEKQSIDYNFVKYLNIETQKLGNKVIFFSSLIILIYTNFITINEFDISGIKVNIENKYFLLLIFLINSYYFIQFYFNTQIDKLNFKIPDDFNQQFDIMEKEIEKLGLEIETINDKSNKLNETINLANTDIDVEKIQERIKNLNEKSNNDSEEKIQSDIDELRKKIKYFSDEATSLTHLLKVDILFCPPKFNHN